MPRTRTPKLAARGKSARVANDKPAKRRSVLTRKAALSDTESSDNDHVDMPIVGRTSRIYADADDDVDDFEDAEEEAEPVTKNGEVEEEEEEEEGDDEDMDEDVFVVEKILGHMVEKDGALMFKVKWEGYDKKADQTWEPEDSLREGAEVILERYLAEHGGRDQIIEDTEEAVKTKKRGRKSAGAEPNKRSRRNGHPADTTPPAGAARAGAWQPPAGSWEDHIDSIDACEDEATGKLVVFLNWKNGKKTKHPTEVVYRRCPQKMLRFYENHVRIVKNETAEGLDIGEVEDAVRDTQAKTEV